MLLAQGKKAARRNRPAKGELVEELIVFTAWGEKTVHIQGKTLVELK